MIEKFPFEKIYYFLKKYYFLILVIIFLILLSLAGMVYYQYIYFAINHQPQVKIYKAQIAEEELNQILNQLDKRQNTLDKVKANSYKNPFGSQSFSTNETD